MFDLELSAVGDDHLLLRGAALGSYSLDLPEGVIAFDELSKDDVLTVQPRGLGSANEELGSVGVGSSVGHGQAAEASVLSGLASEGL